MPGVVHADEWSTDRWSHEALMQMQARMAPGDIKRMAQDWKIVLSELDSLFAEFLDDVTATIARGWSGPGARVAQSTMDSYVENSRAAFREANTLSAGLNVLATATSRLREKIAVPAPTDGFYGRAGSFVQDMDRWEQALRQVHTLYSVPAVVAGNAVAELAGPHERLRFSFGTTRPSVADEPDEQERRVEETLSRWGLLAADANLPPGTLGMPPQIPVTVMGVPVKPLPGKGFGQDRASGRGVDELGEDDVYATQDWMRDPLWRENPTRAAGFDTGASAGRGPAVPLPPDRAPSIGGRSTFATTPGGSTTRTGGAMMPMMGMYPPHAGQQRRGDEHEHYSPPYLVNRDNTRALLGEMPKGTAPVIGLWDKEDEEWVNGH